MSTIGHPVIVLLDVHLLFSPTHPADGTAHPAAVVEGSATAGEASLVASPAPLDACVAQHPAGGGR